jgi:hypothetical protein
VFRKVSKQLGFEDPAWLGVASPPPQPPPATDQQPAR